MTNTMETLMTSLASSEDVFGTKRNSMKNCNVSHSKNSGLFVDWDGFITIDGNGTTIYHNCTNGYLGTYGLDTYNSSCSIHLVTLVNSYL